MEFLNSRCFSGIFDLEVTTDSCNVLIESLSKCKDSLQKVFGKASVVKYQVAGFFLQLIAAKMLIFEWKAKGVKCVIARDSKDEKVYDDILKWEGFTFRYKARGHSQTYKQPLGKLEKLRQAELLLASYVNTNAMLNGSN